MSEHHARTRAERKQLRQFENELARTREMPETAIASHATARHDHTGPFTYRMGGLTWHTPQAEIRRQGSLWVITAIQPWTARAT